MAQRRPAPPHPRLLGLASVAPPIVLRQSDVIANATSLFDGRTSEIDRLLPVFANAGIETRRSCVPLEWFKHDHGWAERHRLYTEHAVVLIERAAGLALERAGRSVAEVDGVVVASSTGIATPSLDALLMQRMSLRADVARLPIFGLGCAGGVVGLARASDLARSRPGATILFLVVELCALTFRKRDHSKSNIVAAALFGDGAAAAVLSTDGSGPEVTASGEHTWTGTLDIMGWNVEDDGLGVLFSRDIPAYVRRHLRGAAQSYLARQDLALDDIAAFVCHPGGAKVMDAIEQAFSLPDGALRIAREVLREFGNMSAATVLFVLERMLRPGGGRHLLSCLGPGFTAGFLTLEAGAP